MESAPPIRCKWVGKNELAIAYHDTVWGLQPEDDRGYFQALCLEVLEAGLNFKLILGKVDHLRKQYKDFDPKRVARMTEVDIEKILTDTDGLRSRMKAEAIIHNASAVVKLAEEHGSFGAWVGKTARLEETEAVKEFKKHFKFVGPTIMCEFLSSTGHKQTPHDAECFMAKGRSRRK